MLDCSLQRHIVVRDVILVSQRSRKRDRRGPMPDTFDLEQPFIGLSGWQAVNGFEVQFARNDPSGDAGQQGDAAMRDLERLELIQAGAGDLFR